MTHRAIAQQVPVTDEHGILIWEISESEGRTLAEAANRVIRHYDIRASQKALDWGGLIACVFTIYMPKVKETIDANERAMKMNTAGAVPPQAVVVA